MGKKKAKSVKKHRSKKGGSEDVQASTSLPPSVDGQLRCFLRVTVSKVSWLMGRPPETFYFRLKWWGEQSNGSIFRPSDGREESKSTVRKTARYPIRCGPKQFADYLNAMSTCVFELLKGQQMSCIGKVTVSELGLLSPQNPISGVYPVFSNQKMEKLGEVNISIKFEPLPVSYDSSSSVPTTDVSLPTHQGRQSTTRLSILKKEKKKTSSVRSSSSHQPQSSDAEGSRRDRQTPSGVDKDYSFVIGPGAGAYEKPEEQDKVESDPPLPVKITPDGTHSDTGTDIFSSSQRTEQSLTNRRKLEFQPTSGAGKHLISAILDKGNKLMDSMIRAQCEAQPTGSKAEKPRSDPTPEPAGPLTGTYPLRRSSSGELFRELLKDNRSSSAVGEAGREFGKEKTKKQDPCLELVVGDVITDKELNQVQTMLRDSPAESVDSDDVLDGLTTDSDDPLHEQNILEELFYKRQRSSSDSDGLSDILLSSDSETELPRQRRTSQRKGKVRKHVPVKDGDDKGSHKKGMDINEKEEESQMVRTREEKEDGRNGKDEDDSLDTSSVASLLHSSRNGVDGLSVQRLTLLGRVHAARVVIDTLTLFREGRRSSLGAGSRIPRRIKDNSGVRGKPPRPQLKSTYFIEYQFPITATGEDSDYANNMATEVMRVVSKKVTEMKGNTEVQFGHRSIFPLQFDGSTVDHWWTRLLVLRIYHKFAGEKTPSLIAVASVPLKKILLSPNLSIVTDLPLRRKDHQESRTSSSSFATETTSTSRDDKSSHLGNVQISIELTSDSKDFKASLAKMKIDEMKGAKLISLPTMKKGNLNGSLKGNQREPPGRVSPLRGVTSPQGEKMVPHSQRRSPMECQEDDGITSSHQRIHLGMDTHAPQEELTIYTLLLIPDGRGITVQGLKPLVSRDENTPNFPTRSGPLGNTSSDPISKHGRDFVTRNTYLVCRMFWSDDAVRSHVCWGTSHPQFNFSQVAPVLLTQSLLERTRNNFMVVEVWDKKTPGQNDELIGMAKLPLHQFYMSFRDRKIASTILKSQYPVVGIDTYAPIINPFSGVHFGQIKVLLAMGAFHQITALQRLKGDLSSDVPKPERPFHYLERSEQMLNQEMQPPKEKEEHSQVEHVFEVVIEGIRSLPQGEDFVWGEADCFIQYHFPCQERRYNQIQGSLNLRSFRSATTLCLPDPVFNEVTRHRISLPANVPVQRELLTACVGVGSAAGYIPFELWCQYYYPNVREQVMAKASLPLAKLCAMVTMQRRGEPSIQTFNLPLRIIQDAEEDGHDQGTSGGFLDLTISYRNSTIRQQQQVSSQGLSVFSQVSLTVSVLRATGLQAAAKSLARYQPSLQYASEVGVNTFVTVGLSFLSKEDHKRSGTIARSFSPELSYHMDFSCPLILHTDSRAPGQMETEMPLAEVLETADLEVKLWHQGQHADHGGTPFQTSEDNSISGRRIVAPPAQILLSSTSVPLKHLLLKKTGLHGWFTINIPMQDKWALSQQSQSPEKPSSSKTYSRNEDGGSLELAIKFARKTDREKVLEVGRRMGWSPHFLLDEDDFSEGLSLPATVSVQINKIFFNEQLALRPGQTGIGSDCEVFIRYQFYDKRPTCSSPFVAKLEHDGNVSVDVKLMQHIKLSTSPALNWYLKEEPFEVQIWVTSSQRSSRNTASRPNKTDRLIGSAYIDLITLITNGGRCRSISGLFPLCKPGQDNMYGACLRGSVTLNLGQHRQMTPTSTDEDGSDEHQGENQEEEICEAEPVIEDMRQDDHSCQEPEPVMEPIPFELHIERAMGLCASPQRLNVSPLSCYVTLQAGGSCYLTTRTVSDSTRPFWNHYQELVLDPQEVVEKQHLIFKIWLQTTGRQDMSCDRMLGFTSVDLGPLLVGFRSLNGWYNIMDFSSQVKGQIKIAITPKRDLTRLKRRATDFMNQMTSPNTSGHLPPMHSLHPYHQPSSQSRGTEEAGVSSQTRDRHREEHIRGVRESHERLQSQRRYWEEEEEDPSLSLLKENLRKNLADLDSLKEKLDHKRRCLDGLEDEDNEKDEDKLGELAGRDESEEAPPPKDRRTVSGVDEMARGTFVADPNTDQSDIKHVQFDQMSQGNDPEDKGTQSESLHDSGSESEESSIVIPRTLNDILPDDRREPQGKRSAEEGSIKADGASSEEVRSETPEEALERIQNRILQVVGSGIPHEVEGRDEEDTNQRDDESEQLLVEEKYESDLRVSGEEENSVPQEEDEEKSEVSGLFSDEEEAASFASSRDEGGGSDRRVGSVTPSPQEKEHLDGEFGKPSISSEDEMGAISGAEEGRVTKSDEQTVELKESLNGHGREMEPVVLSSEQASEESLWQQPTEAREVEIMNRPETRNQEKKRTKETSLAFQLPNFFLRGEDLASAMRNLDSAVSRPTPKSPEVGSLSERISAAREVAKRMEAAAKDERPADRVQRPKKFARTQPTAEEAKRIAKIFSAKYVSS